MADVIVENSLVELTLTEKIKHSILREFLEQEVRSISTLVLPSGGSRGLFPEIETGSQKAGITKGIRFTCTYGQWDTSETPQGIRVCGRRRKPTGDRGLSMLSYVRALLWRFYTHFSGGWEIPRSVVGEWWTQENQWCVWSWCDRFQIHKNPCSCESSSAEHHQYRAQAIR